MSGDPARGSFFQIAFTRLLGAAFVVVGILVVVGKIGWPEWVGYILIANGLIDVFVLPQIMARKYRTPK